MLTLTLGLARLTHLTVMLPPTLLAHLPLASSVPDLPPWWLSVSAILFLAQTGSLPTENLSCRIMPLCLRTRRGKLISF